MAQLISAHPWMLAALFVVITGEDCPPLPFTSVANGKIVRLGRQKFLYKCNEGYYLSGSSETRCYKGNWTSERIPKCYKSGTCSPAPEIPNARLYGSTVNEVRSVVQYVCNPGHVMLGNSMRTCLESGFWSGISPTCMNENEPLQDVADRLGREFVTKMGSHSSDSKLQQAYYLDKASLRNGLDLVILVDRSSSVDPFDLKIAKDFIKFLFWEFGVRNGDNPGGSRAAVVAFGTEVNVLMNLNESQINSPEAASAALDELLLPNGGGTAMVPAMITVVLEVSQFFRKEAKLALFLISDGEPNVGSTEVTPEEMAKTLEENYELEIFAVGVGPDINRQLLAGVASEPVLNHVFILNKYSDLGRMMTIMQNKPTEAPPVRPEKCGHIDPDGGEMVWPWLAAVYASQEVANTTKVKLCAGVLICSQWVLTAASCFFHVHKRSVSLNLKEVFVVLGENDVTKQDPKQTNFYAIDVKVHEDFDPFNALTDNLAVIKLNEPAPLGTYRPVCLPPTDSAVPLHQNRDINATVSGWGTSPATNDRFRVDTTNPSFTLAVKQVIITEDQECLQSKVRKADMSIFCADSSSSDSCVGVPGSPAQAQDPMTNNYHVLGILSLKDTCTYGYTQHVELRKYVPWINQVTKECHLFHWN